MNKIYKFFGNDSLFGRIFGTLGNIIVVNFFFILCSIPVITFRYFYFYVLYTPAKPQIRGYFTYTRLLQKLPGEFQAVHALLDHLCGLYHHILCRYRHVRAKWRVPGNGSLLPDHSPGRHRYDHSHVRISRDRGVSEYLEESVDTVILPGGQKPSVCTDSSGIECGSALHVAYDFKSTDIRYGHVCMDHSRIRTDRMDQFLPLLPDIHALPCQ